MAKKRRAKKVEKKSKKPKWVAGVGGVTYNDKHYPEGEPVPFKDASEVVVHRAHGVSILDAA